MTDEATGANGADKTAAKPKTEVTKVDMKDGRTVEFAGKRNLNKDYGTNPDGSIWARFDFRNGDSHEITLSADDPLIAKLAGHGLVQKGGDTTAGLKIEGTNEPDVDSMSLAVENELKKLANTEADVDARWYAEPGTGDSFSGASLVVKAVVEVTGRTVEFVKTYLENLLEKGKTSTPPLTRQKLYASFRKPGTPTAAVIERMEKEKRAGAPTAVDAAAVLSQMSMGN